MILKPVVASIILLAGSWTASAQSFVPLARFPLNSSPYRITQAVRQNHPFTIVGERGAILGWQDGRFELWSFPVKLLENFHILAELADYPVAIEVNRQASYIDVHPDHTTITYSHPAITVRQHMFVPRGEGHPDSGAVAFFEIDSTLPAVLRFRFDPMLVPQWPAPQFGRPDTSWLEIGSGGGYVLASSDPRFYALVAMPGVRMVKASPYDEWPSSAPLELTLDFDPKRDAGSIFPLIAFSVSGGDDLSSRVREELAKRAVGAGRRVPHLYAATRDYYARFFDDKVTVKTPDPNTDLALRWAQLAIDQSQVRHREETGLVAGWISSGNSARPGFGWFFGRDTLWSLYAVHSYGDFQLARDALAFLIRRQRPDGKIMHEYSQTADTVEWSRLPYWYAAADSTPLFVMAMEDYVRASGDVSYLRRHWSNIQRAYIFIREHDSDRDGVHDNKEGTGWVETWKPKLPNQELYLAALDQQSAESFSRLATIMGDAAASVSALQVAAATKAKLAAYRGAGGFYAFSRNVDGTYDPSRTIFPSVAWWSGRLSLPDADSMLSAWASTEFATDWGTRSLSPSDPFYDPLTYHQGTVWPLFTGWSAMALYRNGRPLAAYSQLMSSVHLTYSYDPGATAEILSGRFFAPMPRGSSRQLWSSAMTLAVAMRGLFGLEVDALNKRLHLSPKLPASWDHAEIHNVPFGDRRLHIAMTRRQRTLAIVVTPDRPVSLCLDMAEFVATSCTQTAASRHTGEIPLPPVEVSSIPEPPLPGAETTGLKVVDEHYARNGIALRIEAPAGTTQRLQVRLNDLRASVLKITGGTLRGQSLEVRFPVGTGYTTQQVEIHW